MSDQRTERERLAEWLRNQRPSLAECEPDCGCNWCRYDRAAALLSERTEKDGYFNQERNK